jgi:hypothetical protein
VKPQEAAAKLPPLLPLSSSFQLFSRFLFGFPGEVAWSSHLIVAKSGRVTSRQVADSCQRVKRLTLVMIHL